MRPRANRFVGLDGKVSGLAVPRPHRRRDARPLRDPSLGAVPETTSTHPQAENDAPGVPGRVRRSSFMAEKEGFEPSMEVYPP